MMIKVNMLKKTALAAMLAAVALPAASQQEFTVTGHIPGLPDSVKVILVDNEVGEYGKKIAEAMPVNGAFELKGQLDGIKMCSLGFQRFNKKFEKFRRIGPDSRLMLGNDQLNIASSVPFDSLMNSYQPEALLTVTGSGKAQEQFREYFDFINKAELKAEKAGYLGAQKYFDSNGDEDTIRKYDALTDAAERELAAMRRDFVNNHPDYHISAYLTQQELAKQFTYTADEINAMAETVKACPDTARLARIDSRRKFALRFAAAMKCPEFDVTTLTGEVKPFASFITPGKYTFIDFWASWCGPCRSAIPHVKELHGKYADRLDIFSVSVDEEEPAWRKAMDEEKMDWTQLRLNGEEQMTKASKAFYLTSIPRLILLNDKGEIVCSTFKPGEINSCIEQHLGK